MTKEVFTRLFACVYCGHEQFFDIKNERVFLLQSHCNCCEQGVTFEKVGNGE